MGIRDNADKNTFLKYMKSAVQLKYSNSHMKNRVKIIFFVVTMYLHTLQQYICNIKHSLRDICGSNYYFFSVILLKIQ